MVKKRPKKRPKSARAAQNNYSGPLLRLADLEELLARPKPKKARKQGVSANRPVDYLSIEQLEKLFRVIHAARDQAMFRIAYLFALRASEVGMLRFEQFREREMRLHVKRLKGSLGGEFRIPRRTGAFLRAWLKERGRAPGPIFRSRNHRAISRRQLDRLMKRYGAAAGLPAQLRHFHVRKHSRGTHLLAETRDVTLVQDQLGHANIQNTMKYARVVSPTREELFDREKDRW
jgi:integrase